MYCCWTFCSPENFAKSAVTQKAFYNSKAGSLFNAMVPGKPRTACLLPKKDSVCLCNIT